MSRFYHQNDQVATFLWVTKILKNLIREICRHDLYVGPVDFFYSLHDDCMVSWKFDIIEGDEKKNATRHFSLLTHWASAGVINADVHSTQVFDQSSCDQQEDHSVNSVQETQFYIFQNRLPSRQGGQDRRMSRRKSRKNPVRIFNLAILKTWTSRICFKMSNFKI